ncbi:required for hyphal anastomosis [Magnaporthiopsis poae ATCC 64411]|uniref:Required for hyphal anastomosis n=1 Tax=Magnaporthiopsis poae (strain ATCC 64411 / 73-15) TaxID=644358 RepID=A0A0C4E4B6_MAGP6|nr:required for hyphal anastomosis [Magnaporthiopsis poae ATCC 64411]
MNSLWPSRGGSGNDAQGAGTDKKSAAGTASDIDGSDVAASASSAGASGSQSTTSYSDPSKKPLPSSSTLRPSLVRNQLSQPPPAVPPPPSQPPPPPGQMAAQQPPDSLSLAQLRRFVAEFPHPEPLAYDFVYEDFGPPEEEIDEWFVYQSWQEVRLRSAQMNFDWQWQQDFGDSIGWDIATRHQRSQFLQDALQAFSAPDAQDRSKAIGRVVYAVLGRWKDTAGGTTAAEGRDAKAKSAVTDSHLAAMKDAIRLLVDIDGLKTVWDSLQQVFEQFWGDDLQLQPNILLEAQLNLMNLMTIMYMTLQVLLSYPAEMSHIRPKLLELNPNIVGFMLVATAKLRWDDMQYMPQTQVLLLFWKTILLVFGGTPEMIETKRATCETGDDDKEKNIITASPLDYHAFRQEITSKYPAYIPPQTAIPIEADNTSLLPPLPHQPSRNNGSNGILPGPPNAQASGASILHQPVHIATPAPSPPPSPGVGGKGGKKQNYQTNQNFPFMYPPLDATSNSAGGKGIAGLQDLLVGRKWEGSDIPASILEAGELFSKRVRMTRATRQLWDERERFIKYSRGWDDDNKDILDELDLSGLSVSEKEELGLLKSEDSGSKKESPADHEVDYGPNPEKLPEEVRKRLDALEKFYSEALPNLQSLVIILLKTIVHHVSVLASTPPQGQQQAGTAPNGARPVNGVGSGRGADAPNGPNTSPAGDGSAPSDEEIDGNRNREITAKAVSGILLLLLKWLKLSHILKFEFLGQLLLDSNYLLLILKLFAHQDIQQTVDSKADVIEKSFFYWCNHEAGSPAKPVNGEENDESEDDALPPPIKRRRSPTGEANGSGEPNGDSGQAQTGAPTRPEVDELGCPVNALPNEPITDFSRRNFFSLINFLRVMQKVCKGKAHRNLLLVHYKSSNILRKSLKVPQPELRLYTLKLFKNQVPYCGRKWRQGNMRVITAVYLHCRPELRDEWLAGSDIDAEVEEALPLEQALRSLTHWFNIRRYPDRMGPDSTATLREGHDFFARELERADLQWTGDMADDGSSLNEWDGMPPSQ